MDPTGLLSRLPSPSPVWFRRPNGTDGRDADGLDPVRLGDLDVGHLRYPVSRLRVARAEALLLAIP
jgi:hypothetical protein